ncbi:hypothetical protein RhiJN_18930 [Ceratobasidium sp. AG-Ba]|nr:hypothetical protein RhiJN_18930 [Ceratobasidium sp. AG-Ba]
MFASVNPEDGSSAYSIPSVPRSPPPQAVAEEPIDDARDRAENDQPFIGKRRSAIKYFRKRFGFVDPDRTRRARKKETALLGANRVPSDSGRVLPKFGPAKTGFALPLGFNREMARHPRPVHPITIPRHIQWRVTPYINLSKSPLNPTIARALQPRRPVITLCGSEHFIRLDISKATSHALHPSDDTLLTSAPGIPGIALSPYPLAVQLRHPPPHVVSRPFKHSLGGILQEEHLVCFLDSEYRLRQWRNELAKLALRIAQTDEAIIPVCPQLVDEWNFHLTAIKSAAKSCSKIIDRDGDINFMSSIARRNHLEKLLPRLAKVQE